MTQTDQNVEFLSFPMYQSRISLFKALPHTEDAIVFLGDSLTQRNQWQEYFPEQRVLNRGIDSDRSLGILRRLDHIISLKPNKIFMMIGINDVNDSRSTESILTNYDEVIRRIQSELPHTKLHIQSLLPVNNSVYEHQINNEDVKNLNKKLSELAEKYSIPFIDIYSHVVKENELDAKYTVDGCHLSGEGYQAWVEVIREYVLGV